MSMDEFIRIARRDFQITYSVIVHSKKSVSFFYRGWRDHGLKK